MILYSATIGDGIVTESFRPAQNFALQQEEKFMVRLKKELRRLTQDGHQVASPRSGTFEREKACIFILKQC